MEYAYIFIGMCIFIVTVLITTQLNVHDYMHVQSQAVTHPSIFLDSAEFKVYSL